MEELEKLDVTEHLAELRDCLIISFAAVAGGFAISYAFVKKIGELFFRPLYEVMPSHSSLIFTSYQEAFFFI